ncbi:hypothetical protein H2203_006401 [Taxawa tesnikishii (nom. ined.)]|nr:hypothetical protein H2203_006401 [Dothideales sp. JES 119]
MVKGALTFYSGYFRAALDPVSGFEESRQPTISLEEHTPTCFEVFRHWIYTRKLRDHGGNEGEKIASTDLCKLWVSGDYLRAPMFQNTVMDAIIDRFTTQKKIPTCLMKDIYRKIPEQSPLRRIIIEFVARRFSKQAIAESRERWSADSLLDLLQATWPPPDKLSYEQLREMDRCPYHIHEEGVRCTSQT